MKNQETRVRDENICWVLQNCIASKETESQCSSYCYSIVRHLLQHARQVHQKEQQFYQLESKIQEQKLTIVKLERSLDVLKATEKIRYQLVEGKDKELATQSDLIAAQRTQLASKDAELKELQELRTTVKKLEKSVTELKTSDKVQLEIIKGKDKELAGQRELAAAYKTQLSLKDDELSRRKGEADINKIQKMHTESCSAQKSAIQEITLNEIQTFSVSCDAELAGPGWMVIQRRVNANENFNRPWADYRLGFGSLSGSFFMGLEKLHKLTVARPHELYVYLKNSEGETRYAHYDNFVIGNASEQYSLKSLTYQTGTAGDALESHLGMKFTTYDVDNDLHPFNCAEEWLSGWWFHTCLTR